MGSALPGRFLLDDSERRCESGERERERGMSGLERRMGPRVYLLAVYVRLRYAQSPGRLSILSISSHPR